MNTCRENRIITNNPRVLAKYPAMTDFIDTGAEGVLKAVRDRVHSGAVVISHPLSGSMAADSCPYRSIIISRSGNNGDVNTDFLSLQLIESALDMARPPSVISSGSGGGQSQGHISITDSRLLDDYQVIDLDIIESAINKVTTN